MWLSSQRAETISFNLEASVPPFGLSPESHAALTIVSAEHASISADELKESAHGCSESQGDMPWVSLDSLAMRCVHDECVRELSAPSTVA